VMTSFTIDGGCCVRDKVYHTNDCTYRSGMGSGWPRGNIYLHKKRKEKTETRVHMIGDCLVLNAGLDSSKQDDVLHHNGSK
jgi:hypothetical protein